MSLFSYPPAMRRLINELMKLPSVGEKSAARLAYHLIVNERSDGALLAEAIVKAKEVTSFCERCFSLTEEPVCEVCTDSSRMREVLCVVEKPSDVVAIERTGGFRGVYHVLHGLWSPLRGVSPSDTKLGKLIERVRVSKEKPEKFFPSVNEVVVATSATVEGDATALYIANQLGEFGVRVSRIAQGIPQGGELEYADERTLSQAIEGRRNL